MIRLTQINIEEFQFVSGEKPDSILGEGLTERTATFDHRFGNGRVKDCVLRDMHFMAMDLSLNQRTEIAFATNSPVLELQFNIEGSYHHPDSTIRTGALPSNPSTHNIIFFPPQRGNFIHRMNAQHSKTLEIHLTHDYFLALLGRNFPEAENFLKKMERCEFALMNPHSLPLTAQMTVIIRDMLGCTKNGILKKLFYEAKILELLMLQLEQISGQQKSVFSLKQRDIDLLHEAKWIIENNLQDPYSIPELAKKVGVNEFKLKKAFKQLFGVTIFGHISDLRMAQAKAMILDGHHSLNEIADLAGYQHTHHFSAAFKKKYGLLPAKFKK